MKKNIISIYIISMVLAFNCYSPFLTYNANLWNNLSFEREYPSAPEDYKIYAVQKAFEEIHLTFTRIIRYQDKEQLISKKFKNMQSTIREDDRNSSEPVNVRIKTFNKHLNSENKKLALLKLGVKKEKIISCDDVEDASFFLFT